MKAYKKPTTTIFKVELEPVCTPLTSSDTMGDGNQLTRKQEAWDGDDE